jgi:hypothetical protein
MHDVKVILCLHAAPGSQSNEVMSDSDGSQAGLWQQPDKYQPWAIDIWRTIAQRYANETAVGGYDLLDEPIPVPGHESQVRPFYVKVTQAIRSVDRNHIIFVEGTGYAMKIDGMKDILPPWDKNLVYDFHKYAFGHDYKGMNDLRHFRDVRRNLDVPIVNGETGENSDAWAHSMAKYARKNGIGWVWWTYKKVDRKTQPYTIHSPPGYEKILAYVKEPDKVPPPPKEEARKIMLALADNAKTEKCSVNNDVIQALLAK